MLSSGAGTHDDEHVDEVAAGFRADKGAAGAVSNGVAVTTPTETDGGFELRCSMQLSTDFMESTHCRQYAASGCASTAAPPRS